MVFQSDEKKIMWKMHFTSPLDKVFQFLSTDEGRNKFWAQTTETQGKITFVFPNGFTWEGKIQKHEPPHIFSITYIDNSKTTFELKSDGKGGTDLELTDAGVQPEYRTEVIAGWGSVLMALKGAADFGIDLRNHDPQRTWDQGYFDN